MDYAAIICESVLVMLALLMNGATMVHKWCYVKTSATPLRLTVIASCVTQLLLSAFPHMLYIDCLILPPPDHRDPGQDPSSAHRRPTADFEVFSHLVLQTLTSFIIAATVVTQLLKVTSRRPMNAQWKMKMTVGALVAAVAYALGLVFPVFLKAYQLPDGKHTHHYTCKDVFLLPLPPSVAWKAVCMVLYLLPSVAVILSFTYLLIVVLFSSRKRRPLSDGQRDHRLEKAAVVHTQGVLPRSWLPATLISNSVSKCSNSEGSSVCSGISLSSVALMTPARKAKRKEDEEKAWIERNWISACSQDGPILASAKEEKRNVQEKTGSESDWISAGSPALPKQEDVPILTPLRTDRDPKMTVCAVSGHRNKGHIPVILSRNDTSTTEEDVVGCETDMLLPPSDSPTVIRNSVRSLLPALFVVCLIQLTSAMLPICLHIFSDVLAGSEISLKAEDVWSTAYTVFTLAGPVFIPSIWLVHSDI